MVETSSTVHPESFESFGDLLRFLRERAELSQRELALQVGYHYSYMSRIEKNERMPDTATLMARFVPALGLDNEPNWTARLLELAGGGKKTSSRTTISAGAPSTIAQVFTSLFPNLTPLLGRQTEVNEIIQLISRDDVRLLTLVGPPGVGKTRLAIQVANEATGLFSSAVAFADLSPTNDSGEVLNILANALNIPKSSDTMLMSQLTSALKNMNILLVIDNFEHVINAAPQLIQLLGNAPLLKILVTSREALRIPGERVFSVEPLPLPPKNTGQTDDLLKFAAIQLFTQRAQAADSKFEVNQTSIEDVAEICRRLDGLPLAIELVAARIKSLSPRGMLAQFDRRLDWTAQGSRDANSSRRTLRGAIEWSYNALSETEQVLMRRLSIFSGGWTANAAELVCHDLESLGVLKKEEVFQTLFQLVDKSLVVADKNDDQTRFRFLETIHEFAREKLETSGEVGLFRSRSLEYFVEVAKNIEANLDGEDQITWTRTGEMELNNIRAAMDWGLKNEADFMKGLQIASSISIFWIALGYLKEGLEWSKIYLEKAKGEEYKSLRAHLLFRCGGLAGYMGDLKTARSMCEEALEENRALNRNKDIGNSLYYLSEIALKSHNLVEARAELNECVSISWQEEYIPLLTVSLTDLANMDVEAGNFEEGLKRLNEVLSIASRKKDQWGLAHALRSLGFAHLANQNYDDAIMGFEQALEVTREIGNRPHERDLHTQLSLLYFLKGEFDKSSEYANKSFAISQSIGDDANAAFPLRMMAYVAVQNGNLIHASALIHESLLIARQTDDLNATLGGLIGLAYCSLAQKNFTNALKLCSLVKSRSNDGNFKLPESEQKVIIDILKECKKQLTGEEYKNSFEAGQTAIMEEMLEDAMGE